MVESTFPIMRAAGKVLGVGWCARLPDDGSFGTNWQRRFTVTLERMIPIKSLYTILGLRAAGPWVIW